MTIPYSLLEQQASCKIKSASSCLKSIGDQVAKELATNPLAAQLSTMVPREVTQHIRNRNLCRGTGTLNLAAAPMQSTTAKYRVKGGEAGTDP